MASSSSSRIALVTGANQGIGFGLVQALAHSRKFDTILLGSRDLSKGEEAASLLRSKESFENIQPIQLDLTNENSIKDAFKTISQKFGHLNLLINNAGIAFKGSRFDEEVCRVSADTNYQGTVNVTEALLPLLTAATSARIVNISSLAGRSALRGMSEANRARFLDPNLTKPQLDDLLAEFILSVRSGTYKGWPESGYGTSKACLSMYTRIRAPELPKTIQMNACCPGWVRTNMAGPSASKSVEEGVVTPMFLAISEEVKETGTFWSDKQRLDWV